MMVRAGCAGTERERGLFLLLFSSVYLMPERTAGERSVVMTESSFRYAFFFKSKFFENI